MPRGYSSCCKQLRKKAVRKPEAAIQVTMAVPAKAVVAEAATEVAVLEVVARAARVARAEVALAVSCQNCFLLFLLFPRAR
jgi:hypothetical protein